MALKFSTKIFIVFSLFLFLHSHFILGQNDRETWQPPEQIMDSIGVKPGTQLVIIERNTLTERAHYPAFMTKKQILDTIEKTNYKLDRILTFLPRDAIYIYKLKD